ncbi:MAG: RNA methyltransferase [Deltaproteobacteria bacterium]|nr:RNA methyltransferase [Deltaproteobacteria bacterium]
MTTRQHQSDRPTQAPSHCPGVNLDNIAIVLHRPKYPENIGAAARAGCNMGIKRLVVVDPLDCDLTRVLKMATHFAADIVQDMEIFKDLKTALAPFQYVVGSTARVGGNRPTLPDPRRLAQDLIPISQKNQVALVFGPEDTGLTNLELGLCHAVVTIPTAAFSSLNLAQAVMVLCYELFSARGEDRPTEFVPRLAERYELEAMYDHLKEILVAIDFINSENPDYWMQHVRRFFSRIPMRARDVRMIRGICRQIAWYGSKDRT